MFKNKKIVLGIILILIIIITLLIGISIGNKNTIQRQLGETQKLTETNEGNSFVKTLDHLSEVNSSVQSIWESIRNSETLSSKTDSSGNYIYTGVNDVSSLEKAIEEDNNNYYTKGKIDGSVDSQSVQIIYHEHTDACYKQCGGIVGSYGLDKFGTMVCRCTTCGYDYTYKAVPGCSQVGANGNNNYPNSALGGCIQKYLNCGKNENYVESIIIGDKTYTP